MYNPGDKVIYIKASSHGIGAIPLNSTGTIIKYIKEGKKALVDFKEFGVAIIPESALEKKL